MITSLEERTEIACRYPILIRRTLLPELFYPPISFNPPDISASFKIIITPHPYSPSFCPPTPQDLCTPITLKRCRII